MSTIERQVKIAQRRLWLNRFLRQWGWSLTAAFGLWLVGWLLNRLLGLYAFPAGLTLLGAFGLSFIAAVVWLLFTRDEMLAAATVLDQAAGLRERVSTVLSLPKDGLDAFQAAVIQDASEKVAPITPRKFLPVRWPGSLSMSSLVVVIALFSLLLPEFDLLGRKDRKDDHEAQAGLKTRTQTVLAKTTTTIEKIAEENRIDLNAEQKQPKGRIDLPERDNSDFKRRETIKKLDRLQDALKQKIGSEKFKALKETKKRLRQLNQEADSKSELSELISAMAANDFAEAQKAVKKLQEKLAKREADGAPSADIKKMQAQLKELAEKMQQAAKSSEEKQKQQQTQALQNTGLSKEEAQRVLEELSKKDPKQLEKLAKELAQRLKDKGVTEEAMKKMLEKMQQQQKACDKAGQQCKEMSNKMDQAAKQMEKGNMDQAQKELGETGESLSEMEQLEQALNELESQMSELEQAGQEMEQEFNENKSEQQCGNCAGTGFREDGAPCPKCNGRGQCAGSGRGAGPRDRDDNVETDTVDRRAKTKFGRGGGIVGQQFVKDKQLKGESSATMTDAESAAEIDDTDAIERERIPRIYRKGVKRFFDRGDEDGGGANQDDAAGASDAAEKKADSAAP